MDILDFKYECTDALEFSKRLPDNTIKLIITSPPYNIGKAYEDKVGIDEYLENMKPMLSEFVRILSEDGSICWQTGNYVSDGEVYPLDIYFYPIFKKLGLHLRNRIIWHFGHGLHCTKRFSGRYETILWFTKSDNYTFNLDDVRIPSKYPGKRYYKGEKKGQVSGNPKGKNPEDVWELTVERLYDDWESLIWDIPNVKANHPEKVDHPCQFPIELVERCVLALTNVGDIVYDPFAGVGSALLGALKNGRRAYGTELVQKYVDIGLERIKQLKEDTLKTRPIYKKIYKPKPTDKIAQIPKEWTEGDKTLCK
ncbi:site-specific DNA-methyltransferase (plasmid) [Thermoanaerobacterium thermosaccharolyticum]|uniref:DNA-methyltransferase n=1 Tax=Thermoanaerobacterium thermosaccharolyticum TaxID=1517 RepID=UPI003D264FC8